MLAADENIMIPAMWLCLQWHLYSTKLIKEPVWIILSDNNNSTSPLRGQRRPSVLHSLGQYARIGQPHGSWGAVRSLELCLLLEPAVRSLARSDAIISSCVLDVEPLSPPAPPRFFPDCLSGCRGGSADVELSKQRSLPVRKHRRRWNVFPDICRTFSALRVPSSPRLATPKVGWDAGGELSKPASYLLWACDMNVWGCNPDYMVNSIAVQKLRSPSLGAVDRQQTPQSGWS